MQITNDVSHAAAATGTTPLGNAKSTSTDPVSSTANEQTFLQLMVAQIQNQDPLSPTDSTQFVTQLAQFSSLEQLIGIHASIDTLNAKVASTGTPGGSTSPASGA